MNPAFAVCRGGDGYDGDGGLKWCVERLLGSSCLELPGSPCSGKLGGVEECSRTSRWFCVVEFGKGAWAAEVVALGVVDSQFCDLGVGGEVSHVFCNGFPLELVGDEADGLDDGLVECLGVDFADEVAVDFDEVDGDVAQLGEGGEAAPEVVQGEGDFFALEVADEFYGVAEVLDEGGFGDFEGDSLRVYVGVLEIFEDVVAEAGGFKGLAGKIDGDFQGGGGLQVANGALDDVFVEEFGHAVSFRDSEEVGGNLPQSVFILPAEQGFKVGDFSGGDVDDGHVPEFEDVLLDGEFDAGMDFRVALEIADDGGRFFEDFDAVASLAFGGVAGGVGVGDDFLTAFGAVDGGEADGEAGLELLAVDGEGEVAHGFANVAGSFDSGLEGAVSEEGDKFVSGKANESILRFEHAADDSGDFFDEVVSCRVADGVVDDFELVHVHEKHHGGDVFSGAEDVVGEGFVEGVAVQESGQEVVAGQVVEAVFAFFLFGGVAAGEDDPALSVGGGEGFGGGFKPAVHAVEVFLSKGEAGGTSPGKEDVDGFVNRIDVVRVGEFDEFFPDEVGGVEAEDFLIVQAAVAEKALGVDLRNQVEGVFREGEEAILNFLHDALCALAFGGVSLADGVLLVFLAKDGGDSGL